MRASRLSHVAAAAAALAAKFGGGGAHQLDCVKAPCQIRGDADHDTCLPVAVDANDRDNPGADAKLCFVGERFEIVQSQFQIPPGKRISRRLFLAAVARLPRRLHPSPVFCRDLAQLAFKFPAILNETRQAVGRVFLGSLQQRRDVMQLASPRVEIVARLRRRLGLDAADTRRDRSF